MPLQGVIELLYLKPMGLLLEEITPVLQPGLPTVLDPTGLSAAPRCISPQQVLAEHLRVCRALAEWVGMGELVGGMPH